MTVPDGLGPHSLGLHDGLPEYRESFGSRGISKYIIHSICVGLGICCDNSPDRSGAWFRELRFSREVQLAKSLVCTKPVGLEL